LVNLGWWFLCAPLVFEEASQEDHIFYRIHTSNDFRFTAAIRIIENPELVLSGSQQ
jgi:hypothetical protein